METRRRTPNLHLEIKALQQDLAILQERLDVLEKREITGTVNPESNNAFSE